MSTPFLGQISTFGFNFAPKGFALCNGQLLPINQNQALFSLLGITYGGNGVQTFALPNLQGAASLGFGTGVTGATYFQGQIGGEINHTLITGEIPAHTHTALASGAAGTASSAAGAYPAPDTASPFGTTLVSGVAMASNPNAGGQAHSNQSPALVINFCIALTGIFPSRN